MQWIVLDSSLEEDVSGLYSLVAKLEIDLCLYKSDAGYGSAIQALDELDAYFGEGYIETSHEVENPEWKR